MRKTLIALVVSLGIAGGSLFAALANGADADLWQSALVPCSPEVCGGFPNNTADFALQMGQVTVLPRGLVKLTIVKLTDLSGTVLANKTLDVNVGSFVPGTFAGALAGTITTDSHGNFEGTIDTGGGVPFAFASGATVSAQFVLNDPGIRSEFVTGFTVR
jgi:hypothetical protein